MTTQPTIRAGDTVHVKATVQFTHGERVEAETANSGRLFIRYEVIERVERRPFKIGDKVTLDNGNPNVIGRIDALADNEAWVLWFDDARPYRCTYSLDSLTPAD